MKYATFTAHGYELREDSSAELPTGAIALTGEQFAQLLSGGWTLAPDGALSPKPPAPAPTTEQIIAANIAAIQSELDRQAQTLGYDNIISACSYAAQAEGEPFQAEGAAFLAWRSAVWSEAYAVLAQVEAGTTPMPTPEEAVAQMPALVLP